MVNPWAAYYEKSDNLRKRPERRAFFDLILRQTTPMSVLEVGCGDGLNLSNIGVPLLVGTDCYLPAIKKARERVPHALLAFDDARWMKWDDAAFDLAFTCTTLQHISDDADCLRALRELIRVSRRWVLVMEYAADERTPVLWRGDDEGIVKRPWWAMIEGEGLTLKGTGLLTRDDGFDDVSWYLAKR